MNLEKAIKSFEKYVQAYDLSEDNIKRKYHHSYRVMKLSKEIAQSMNLNKEQTELAELIGLLHDIARFKQWTTFKTYSDLNSFDHGDYAVKILEEQNFIREFIEEEKFDNIIKVAIKNHNKLNIEEGLNETELLFSKIIRDADKLDIMYGGVYIFNKKGNEMIEIENGLIKESIIGSIKNKTPIKREKDTSRIENMIILLATVFDLNFKYSFKYLEEKDYINKIIDRYSYKKEQTKEQMEIIRKYINTYIKEENIKHY